MIVCVCHAVSETRLHELLAAGASENDMVRLTGAGTSCGCCVDTLKALVARQRPPCGKEVPCPGCECLEQGVRAKAA